MNVQLDMDKGKRLECVFSARGKARLRPDLREKNPCGKQINKMFWAAFRFEVRTALVPVDDDSGSMRHGVTT